MRKQVLKTATMCGALVAAFSFADARAFCGFYVAKADASLFNEASQVVVTRNENKTVISMMNDFQGDLKEFALVVPVPQVLERGQINVGDKAHFERIDAYTAPRLVEYFDENPCEPQRIQMMKSGRAPMSAMEFSGSPKSDASLGVKVEAKYTVGEYDISILSAKQSDGLEVWLNQNGYKIPKGASSALQPYIKQDMKFFVAKVNIKEQTKTGLKFLRPLQFAFESEKFMLPVRLGMLNSKGEQDLIVYMLTKNGRVETTNYRTTRLPSGMDLPPYVKSDFARFYKDMFSEQARKENLKSVFTEYFWDMGWCDPCAADPLTNAELRGLGVFWLDEVSESPNPPRIMNGRRIMPPNQGGAVPVKVTRLHLRYTKATLPEDLMFQETKDQENFQARYVLRHPWKGGENSCSEAKEYFRGLKKRQEKEAQTLATLTGWDINDVRKKMSIAEPPKNPKWWNNIW